LYSALHGIQTTLKCSGMDHTQFYLTQTPCLPYFVSKSLYHHRKIIIIIIIIKRENHISVHCKLFVTLYREARGCQQSSQF